jgi:mycothiol S-conjugate amidase
MQVHAHPDDEASKGSGTTARYAAEGVRNVLVCCTGGEAGDILNPAVEHPGSPEALYEMRMAELRESVRVLGYDALHLLGYHDSGMPDTEDNARPDNFANAPLDEAVGRLVRIIREERPQVIITYRDEQNFYPHPDHLRVHEISGPAFELAGDPEAYPDLGPPWQPSKLYYVGWSIARVKALHETYLARGEESRTPRGSNGVRHRPGRRLHHAHRRRRLPPQAPRSPARTGPRSIRKGSGCASRRRPAKCSRGRSSSSPDRW